MRKNIVFDLDGVLVNSSAIHRTALSQALLEADCLLTEEDQNRFEAMSTKQKLASLVEANRLTLEQSVRANCLKKEITRRLLDDAVISPRHLEMLSRLVKEGYTVQIASNSIEESVAFFVQKYALGIGYIGNDTHGVTAPKPHPSMYLLAMQRAGCGPHDTLIVEDSPVGLQAAYLSGAKVLAVKDPDDVTYEKIVAAANAADSFPSALTNIIVPMAGAGERFRQAGYQTIKPLIPVAGRFMLDVAVKSLGIAGRHIFIARKQDASQYSLDCITHLIAPGSELVLTDGPTEGAVCTTLLAEGLIDNDNELMIVNSDQFIKWDAAGFLRYARRGWDGVTLTFRDTDRNPKWSFVKKDGEVVTEVAEKKAISDIGNVGVYWWRRGRDYVKFAKSMIEKNIRVNNEFYIAPVYNEAIQHGLKIGSFDVEEMHGLGTPEDLKRFLK